MAKRLAILFSMVALVLLSSSSIDDRVSRQQEDFRVFTTVLQEKEGRIDMHLSKDSIAFYLGQLQKELCSEKSLIEQYKLYSSTLSKLNCGHTQILPSKAVQAEWLLEMKDLPFDMYLIGKHLVAEPPIPEDIEKINKYTSGIDPSSLPKSGSEILTIDHLTVEEMMLKMGNYLSGDEGSIDFKYYQAAQMFEFFRHLALPFDKDSIQVKYVTPTADTIERYYATGPAPVYTINKRLEKVSKEYMKGEEDPGKFKIVSSRYGYFRFRSFTASSGRDYDAFLKKAFTQIKDKHIDKIVVDLRGNTGGIMQYDFMKYMVGPGVNIGKYIIEKTSSNSDNKYIKKFNIHYLRHAMLSNQQGRKQRKGVFNEGIIETDPVDESLVYDGQVVVITDEGTFSSAAILACQLKTMKNAKVIGRPAGGSFYSGNAGTLMVKLPESGFQLSVNPNTFYSHLERPENPTKIKEPDLYLDPLIFGEKDLNQFYFKQAVDVFE